MAQDKRQRQRENRQKRLEAERKAARSKALRRRIIQVVVLFVVVVAVLGINSILSGSDDTTTSTTVAAADPTPTTTTIPTSTSTTAAASDPVAIPADYDGYRELPVACGGTLPDPVEPMQFEAPEDQGINAGDDVTATIVTSCGDIVLALDPAAAPETVNSFVFLARAGYFDGTVSHRILPGFVIQAGDPTATGREGPGYTIPDELPAPGFLYEAGTLAMANAGPNTTGSQFFIVLADAPLNPDFSVFGKVVGGSETLERIAGIPLGPNAFGEMSVPLETLYLETISING